MVNRTLELQARLNAREMAIDLGNEVWPVSRLTVTVNNHGVKFQNGTISYFGSDGKPRAGLIELVRNKKWNGVVYPSGPPIDISFENVSLDGGFDYDSGLADHNDLISKQRGMDFNLVSAVTYAAGNVSFSGCQFLNGGQSGWGGSFGLLKVRNHHAHQITKHVFGCPGMGGMRVDIDGLTTEQCGTVFDLSTPDPTKAFYDILNPDVAHIRNVLSIDQRFRTKIASRNWHALLEELCFTQTIENHLCCWPAIDIAENPHSVIINRMTAYNFFVGGVHTLTDDRTGGAIELNQCEFTGGWCGAKVQQYMTIRNSVFDGSFQRYQSGQAAEQNVTLIPATAAEWAAKFDAVYDSYAAFNSQYGTAYQPLIYVHPSIKALMVH